MDTGWVPVGTRPNRSRLYRPRLRLGGGLDLTSPCARYAFQVDGLDFSYVLAFGVQGI